VRVATQYAPPLSSPRGRPSASRADEQTQRSNTSHAEYVPTLTAAAALRVKAATNVDNVRFIINVCIIIIIMRL